MALLDVLAIIAGLAASGWVAWYFLAAERGAATPTAPAEGKSEVRIAVRGGYDPSAIRVAAGRPVRLLFDRQETASCSEEVVFPRFGIRRFLPPHETTTIELTPPEPGTYEFTCGMGMLHGKLIAV